MPIKGYTTNKNTPIKGYTTNKNTPIKGYTTYRLGREKWLGLA